MPILDKDNKDLVEKYKKFLLSNENTRLTQSIEWTKVKSNWKSEIVYLEENNEIVAGMLILIQKIPFFNSTFLYAPRGPVCNIEDINLVSKLVEEVEKLAKQYKAYVLKFDPQYKYNEDIIKLYKRKGFKVSKKDVDHDQLIQPQNEAVLDIDNICEEDLMKKFGEKTRYNIRLSKRKGIEVYYSRDEKDLQTFYELYKITCIRDEIGCRPYEYFKRMLDAFDEEHLRIYITKHEEDKLSAAIAITYGTEMFYLYGASSNEKRNLMPNYSMQWEMIRWGIEKKCKTYNFGGILHLDKNNGLYKFKTGFCREEGVVHYIGEIDKVYNSFIYFGYTKVVPILKKIKRVFRKVKKTN